MRVGLIGFFGVLLLCGGSSVLCAQATRNIRAVDFRNHAYPWIEREGWQSELIWLSTTTPNHVTLKNGRWEFPDLDIPPDLRGKLPFAGLTLEEVVFGDVTGDAKDEAVVVLREHSGGTQCYYLVYIYTTNPHGLALLAYFRSGDRAAQGLYRVFASGGKLVVDLYDPDKQKGDCCSSGFLRTQYKWNDHAFVAVGSILRSPTEEWSRRPVSVFGIPYDQMKK
jgi:hypothetical protein